MPNNTNLVSGVKIPSSPEEVVRIFPQLLSSLQTIQTKIQELENRMKALETISGEGTQV